MSAGRFDGFHALPALVSKTCPVRFHNNKYSVSASMVGRPVDIHAYAERIMIRQDGASRQNVHAAMAPRNRIRSVDATAHHLTNVDLKLDQGQCHVWTYMDPA